MRTQKPPKLPSNNGSEASAASVASIRRRVATANPFAIVTRLAGDLLHAERASLLLPETDSPTLYIVAAQGIPAAIIAETRIRHGDSIAGLVAQRREALLVSAPAATHPGVYRTGSYISVPVPLDRSRVGVLNVSDPIGRDIFTDRDLATLLDLAALISHDLISSVSQKTLQREIIAAREDERQRIARELHDEAGHTLTAAILRLDIETRHAFADPENARRAVERAGTTLLETAVLIHDIAYGLRPRILEDLGLEAALRSLCSRAEAAGLAATFTLSGPRQPLTLEVELAVFRVVQEALTNVQKHAHARQAWIDLHFTAGSLTITVEDNGIGMSHDIARALRKQSGLGLRGMDERITILGGTFTIDRRSEHGIRVLASLPLALMDGEIANHRMGTSGLA